MKTGILITAKHAIQAFPGSHCISVVIGQDAVYSEIVPTMQEAVALKNRLLSEHQSIDIFGSTRYTRSPRGYKGNEHLCRGSNVKMDYERQQ